MKILIIGCGYLGLRAAREWMQRGESVAALTRSPQRAGEWISLGIEPFIGDVMKPRSLASLPEADVALYAVGFDRSGGYDKRDVYVEGLRNVLARISLGTRSLIFISSTSVYGQNRGEVVNEVSTCEPTSPGGMICRDAEQVVREFYPPGDARRQAVILRLAGIYGPGRLIGRTEQLRNQQPVGGNPDAWLNLIHVDDAVEAVTRLAAGAAPSELYLLSDGSPIRRRDYFVELARRAGAPPPVFEEPTESSMNKRCDSTRIREELKLSLRFPSAIEGIAAVLEEDRNVAGDVRS